MTFKTITAAVIMMVLGSAVAIAQQGPVATACKEDIAKLCAGKSHENREARNCLEANKAKVSAACKTALETTGGGKGIGQGKGPGAGKP